MHSLPVRRARGRAIASVAAVLMFAGLIPALSAAEVIMAPAAAAFTAPSLVTNVSPTSVTPPSSLMFGGRQESISINPANPLIVLSASELGGLWRSEDGGTSWKHVDSLPMTAMRQVKFADSDPSLVIATGNGDSHVGNQGGMWRSLDGGATWTHVDTDSLCASGFGSIFGFDIATGTPGSLKIYASSQCGLVYSSNSGGSWATVRPTGGNSLFFDVKTRVVGGNTQVYACGQSGFFFSQTGSSWTATDAASPVNIVPGGRSNGGNCSISVAPNDANSVFVTTPLKVVSADGCSEQLEESDNANAATPTWTDLRACPGDTNGRRPFVVTHPHIVSPPDPNKFEVFFGDNTRIHRNTCDITASPHCTTGNVNWPLYDGSEAHNGTDPTDIAFDPTIPNGCPVLEAGDGGIYKIKDCTYTPAIDDETTGLNALDALNIAGSVYAGHTDLYFGTQDDGLWDSQNAGGAWNRRSYDIYGLMADHNGPPSRVVYHQCCGDSEVISGNEDPGSGAATFNLPASGDTAADLAANFFAAQFGPNRYVDLVPTAPPPPPNTPDTRSWNLYYTTTAGGAWTQMTSGAMPGPPACCSSPGEVQASGPAASPTFFLHLNVGGNSKLYKVQGPLGASAITVDITSNLVNPAFFAVDPSNPLRLYAYDAGPQKMMRSNNGGASWTADNTLTSAITRGNQFTFAGQPQSVALDAHSQTIMVGTVDAGTFASTDNGAHWSYVRGSDQIPRQAGFFFDESNHTIYVASGGRGIWRIDLPHADLSVTKYHTPDPATAGTQLRWTLTVTNDGPDPAPDVTVTDTLPPQVSYVATNLDPPAGCSAVGQDVTCDVGDLDSGASVTFDIVTFVHPDAVVGSGGAVSITNTASTASAAVIDTNASNNSDTDTAIITDSADLTVTKMCKPDTTIYAGTPINCTIFVDNLGPSYARNVVVDDVTLSSGTVSVTNVATSAGSCGAVVSTPGRKTLTCTIGDLANASTTTTGRVTITYTITANDGQDIDNIASVRSDTPDPDGSNNSAEVNLTVTSVADLSISKSGPASRDAGTSISWTLTAHNGGPSTATNVALTDTVPAGVTITSVTMPGGSCQLGTPGDPSHPTVCTIGLLTSGTTSSTMTISATINPQTTGVLNNDARVSSDTFDNNSANDLAHSSTTVTINASLSVAIAATPNPVTAGTPLSYQITVSNAGPSTARAIALSDPLPTDVIFTATGGVGTCGYQTNTNTVTCQLPDLDPGQSEVVFIYTNVKASATASPLSNTVTVTGTGSPPASNTVLTPVQTRADLSIVLMSDLNVYKPSTTIHYQITVTNYGPSDAQSVVITHNLPVVKQGKYISNNIGCAAPVGTTLTCQSPPVSALAKIPAGGSVTFQVNFYITGNKGTITSSASVTSATTDPVAPNNSSTRVVTVK